MDFWNLDDFSIDKERVRAIKNQFMARLARMHGWVWNFLRVTGNPDRIKELKERANLNGRVFNFKAFIPMDGKDFREYPGGRFGWRLKHWGTERNAIDGIIKEDEPDSICYAFKTIGMSRKVFGALEDFCPDLKIEERYGFYPVKVAQRLKALYPDLDIDWSSQPTIKDGEPCPCINEDDIALEEYDEHGGLKGCVFQNYITMDDENIRKFKNLYGESGFSFSMIIPDSPNYRGKLGKYLAEWCYENWGTPSDALPIKEELEPLIGSEIGPEDVLGETFCFLTSALPPFKIYRKMAEDGLVFKITWKSEAHSRWAHGSGEVVDGRFRYQKSMTMGKEEEAVEEKVKELFRRIPREKPSLIVRNREHLDELIADFQRRIEQRIDSFLRECEHLQDFPKGAGVEESGVDISYVEKNVFQLNKTLDLNFLDVSRVTDMSGLFKGFDFLANHSYKYRCQIKINISRWDVSNVTKMANMFDGCDDVDFGDLSKWDRSKVTDC